MERKSSTTCGVPMALCNDNMWGYSTDLIVKHKVRWIEAAAVQPCWTSTLVYYVEESYGHLMEEEVVREGAPPFLHEMGCYATQCRQTVSLHATDPFQLLLLSSGL